MTGTTWRVHLNDSSFDLAVIEIDPGVLERVPHAFLKVVPIPTTGIRGIEVQLDLELARKRLADPPREERTHAFAVLSTLAAKERAEAHMPVIPVHARRERQHKLKRGYREC